MGLTSPPAALANERLMALVACTAAPRACLMGLRGKERGET
jgi:hypothetical protein